MAFIDFTGRAIPKIDAPSLDTTFIPKYEKQGVAPNIVAANNFSKPKTQTVNTLNEASVIGQLPPYPSVTVMAKSISVEQTRTSVNNVKGLNQTPPEAEKNLAIVKDA
jgi:hypothetical protein